MRRPTPATLPSSAVLAVKRPERCLFATSQKASQTATTPGDFSPQEARILSRSARPTLNQELIQHPHRPPRSHAETAASGATPESDLALAKTRFCAVRCGIPYRVRVVGRGPASGRSRRSLRASRDHRSLSPHEPRLDAGPVVQVQPLRHPDGGESKPLPIGDGAGRDVQAGRECRLPKCDVLVGRGRTNRFEHAYLRPWTHPPAEVYPCDKRQASFVAFSSLAALGCNFSR